MTGDNRRGTMPGTIPLTLDEAQQIAMRVDARQELIDAAAAEQAFQGKVAAEFRHLGASDVLRLWQSGRNEKGRKLSKFEVMALGEQWAALTGQPGLPDLGNGTAAAPVPATPPSPAPMPADDRKLSIKDLRECTGLSPSTLKRMERAKTFPAGFKVSTRRKVWDAGRVKAWLAEREAESWGATGATMNKRGKPN